MTACFGLIIALLFTGVVMVHALREGCQDRYFFCADTADCCENLVCKELPYYPEPTCLRGDCKEYFENCELGAGECCQDEGLYCSEGGYDHPKCIKQVRLQLLYSFQECTPGFNKSLYLQVNKSYEVKSHMFYTFSAIIRNLAN